MKGMELTQELLYDLYIVNDMTTREIASHLNVGRSRLGLKLKEFGFTTQLKLEQFKFNNLHDDLMIGSVLGDGGFAFQGINNKFTCRHADKQKDYVQWKLEMLKHVSTYTEVKPSDGNMKRSDKAQMMWYFSTKALPYFNNYANMDIKEAVSKLNNNSLAIWLMDDGSLHLKAHYTGYYTISIKRFTRLEAEYTVNILNEKFGLNPRVHTYENNKYESASLYFPVADTPKIKAIIESSDFYEELKRSMSYKIIQD